MKITTRHWVLGVAAFLLTVLHVLPSVAAESPKERIDYWQKAYGELKPENDPRVARAQDIFSRVLNAAGKRSGVVPRLFMINHNSLIASAIPDGGIIISKKVLDICYQNPQRGDDRLAFVLGHEIAHQLKDDFWDMKFFQAIELSKEKTPEQKKALDEVQAIVGSPGRAEEVLKKELQADEHGIVYASMAGYNTAAVVTEDDKVNFFEEWLAALDPARIPGVHQDASHPSPKQRAETLKARLRQVLENVELFNLGVLFYQAGEYQEAILAFNEFLKFFPSREVYHNLASSHHQLALKYYGEWKGEKNALPFKLSVAIDPETRASKITLRGRGPESPEGLFKTHIEKAIELYNAAISNDPSYALSYSNLACVLIVKGEAYKGKGDLYKAIGLLEDALKIELNPQKKEILNNLGIAYYYAKNPAEAKECLLKASDLDVNYDAPLFNLGKLAFEGGRQAECKEFWSAYLKLDGMSVWANVIRRSLPIFVDKQPPAPTGNSVENVLGLKIGDYDDEFPKDWERLHRKDIPLEEKPYRVITYTNRVMTLSQKSEIKLIVTLESFEGKTERGIALGSPEKEVFSAYGSPTKLLDMTQGVSWSYDLRGIVFRFREGKVVSWILF